jgi:peptidoglycan/xylan/chitin deacetylase (PgdA/CDA1 family)
MRSAFLAIAIFFTGPATPARIVVSGSTHLQIVALTFDAGADRGYAGRILSVLERNHVRASFGMTGRWAQQNPDLVRAMARDGDTFINHTYDHQSFTGYSSNAAPLTTGARTLEILRTEQSVKSLTGLSTKPYFRPPYGDYDAATVALAGRLGYRYMIMWTVDSLGWAHLQSAGILARCLAALHPGDIYLMHVGSQSQDAYALPAFISAAKRRGYRFVTIPLLLAAR